MHLTDLPRPRTLPVRRPVALTRERFLSRVAQGAAAELGAPLATADVALGCAANYLDHCWALVPGLDGPGIEELIGTASLIAADLYVQQNLGSA